jgi:Mg-chelatase subunit ChlD
MSALVSAFISALDNFTPSQIGENGTKEYTWSNSIRERIVQLSFQLTRVRDENTINKLAEQTNSILKELAGSHKASVISREEYLEYMSLMFRLIGQTRDIVEGKGEYSLSYMLLGVWYSHYPELAKFAFKLFLLPLPLEGGESTDSHPYGSWKDVKYLYKTNKSSPLAQYGCQLLLNQLKHDSLSDNPSLAAKWVPREKSQFAELFTELAIDYFPDYICSAKTDESRKKAIIKSKMEFRKLISSLNKKLDTVQIKQCDNHWSEIDPTKQTSITMHKQKKAFLNLKKNGEQRSTSDDRIACAEKFKEFAQKAVKGEVEVKGKRIGLNDFTKEALDLIMRRQDKSDEAAILNAQWLDNSKQTGALGKMIAMVDVSGSMSGDPMNAAIALGIRVAEKSMLGKRVLTFSASPSWVNLTGQDTFVEMVDTVRRADWGMNTNFAAALNMILDAIIQNKLTPEDVEDMVLAIFSDMQMDQADPKSTSLMASIDNMYADAGQRLWGKPFKAPHILFWNLRSTSGFPTLSSQKNASMMSGFSPALLNLFCEEGLSALQSCTPWSLFVKGLSNERYSPLDKLIRETL